MQPTHPFIAVSIGAVIALSPVGTASSQPVSPSNASGIGVANGGKLDATPLGLAPKPGTPVPTEPDLFVSRQWSYDYSDPGKRSMLVTSEAAESVQAAQGDAKPPDPVAMARSSRATASVEPSLLMLADARQAPGEPMASVQNSAEAPASPAPLDRLDPVALEGTDPAQIVQAPPESLPLPNGPTKPEGAPPPTDTLPSPEEAAPVAPPLTPEGTVVPAPNYLDPDPNPLFFPTQPDEVHIVGTQPITLQQALELAQRNSETLRAAQLELDQRQEQLNEALAANEPTVQLNSNLTFQENQNTGFSDTEAQLRGLSSQSDITTSLGGTVQMNYNLFTSGQRSATIRAAEGQVRFQELQVETVAEQLRLDITNAYYDLQEADEQVRISRANLEESQRSLQDAQALERAGVGTRFDVLQSQVDVANSQQELTQNLSDQQVSRRQLARRLNLAETLAITAADPVQPADRWNLSLEDSILLAYRNRAELEQQLVQRDVSEQQRRSALASLGPQVSLFAQYSVNAASNDNQGVEDNYQFGAQLNLNLLDGGAARAQARQQEVNAALAESQFADTRSQVRFEVEQAYTSLQANSDNIQTTTLALQQATEALRLARLRFQAGVGIQSDVLRSQSELTRAEVNNLNAILGYNRSLVQLQRAISNLSGNLAEVP